MKYADMRPGDYVVRTRSLSWAKMLSGAICYVVSVSNDGLVLQITEDCVPIGKKYSIPVEGDDGNWHDVTELVLEANSTILPASVTASFSSPVSVSYRNFLGLSDLRPFEGNEAEGNICMLGEFNSNSGSLMFSKTGYYVAGYKDGYYIAYQGYCEFLEEGEKRKPQLKVLSLGNTRKFYRADEIVNACEDAFNEDVGRAELFTQQVEEATVAASTDPAMRAAVDAGVGRLHLGA